MGKCQINRERETSELLEKLLGLSNLPTLYIDGNNCGLAHQISRTGTAQNNALATPPYLNLTMWIINVGCVLFIGRLG